MGTEIFPPHRYVHRVGYAETDQMGVAHHSGHILWIERARIEMLRDNGISYKALEENGVIMPVRHMHLSYHRMAHFDDELVIESRMTALSPVKCTVDYRIMQKSDESLVAEATVNLAICGKDGRPNRKGAATLLAMAGK